MKREIVFNTGLKLVSNGYNQKIFFDNREVTEFTSTTQGALVYIHNLYKLGKNDILSMTILGE